MDMDMDMVLNITETSGLSETNESEMCESVSCAQEYRSRFQMQIASVWRLLFLIRLQPRTTTPEIARNRIHTQTNGNHPLFQGVVNWTSRGLFQFHSGGNPADGHVGPFVVVNP